MTRIVVVEDEPLVRDLVALNLRHAGYDVATESTIAGGAQRLKEGSAALAIFDMMLPDGDGISLAKTVRANGFDSPILMLTARNEPGTKVASFDAGVDDYLTKPFNVPELMARVRALLRRESPEVQQEKLGILLINIGTPRSTRVKDVRDYLREFLSDPRVIDISPLGRWLLVNAIIAPFRAPKSAEAYKKIWRDDGSPLLAFSRQQTDALQTVLPQHVVRLGMRYGAPSIAQAVDELVAAHVDRLVVVPLYPQYSSAATGSSLEAVMHVLGKRAVVLPMSALPAFYNKPAFLDAYRHLIDSAAARFQPDHVLFSYHGLPAHQVRACADRESSCQRSPHCCDILAEHNAHCYRAQCYATTRALAKGPSTTSFQSRLGRAEWIKPFSDKVVPELAASGVKRLLVVCPSFVTDCLETLEEVGMRLKADFLAAGGEALELVACLNAEPKWIEGLASLITDDTT